MVIHISAKCGSSSVLYLFLINSQLNLTTKEREMLVNNINYNFINNPLRLYKNHKPSNYELLLNKETRKIICSIYKKDIIIINHFYILENSFHF